MTGEFIGKPPNLHYIARNKTTNYLFPSLGVKTIPFTKFREMGFINAYLGWKEHYYNYDNCLWLLFNPSKSRMKEWAEFYYKYRNLPNYINTIDVDLNVIFIVLKIDKKWQHLPDLLKRGKYSKFGNNYAQFFTRYENAKILAHREYFVITKDIGFREKLEKELNVNIEEDWELDSIPDIENEYFNRKMIKNV